MAGNYPPYSGQAEDTTGVPEDWALQQGGVEERYFQRDIAIGAADGNGSQYAIMQGVPAEAIINQMQLEVDAMAGATSYSIGIYDTDTNLPIAPNAYMNAVDIHAGSTKNAPIDGMSALTHAQTLQRIFELAGLTVYTKKGRYDLILTANAAATAAGTISVRGRITNSV